VDALRSASSDGAKQACAEAIDDLSRFDDCCSSLVAAGAGEAIVDALKSFASENAKSSILLTIMNCGGKKWRNDSFRRALTAAGACEAVVDALRSASSDGAKQACVKAILHLSRFDDFCISLFAAGADEAIVDALKSFASLNAKSSILQIISNLLSCRNNNGMTSFAAFLLQQAQAGLL
jgi:hypothetical protein